MDVSTDLESIWKFRIKTSSGLENTESKRNLVVGPMGRPKEYNRPFWMLLDPAQVGQTMDVRTRL